MPLIGTEAVAETAMNNAEAAARTAYMADKTGVLTTAQQNQLKTNIRKAGLAALFAHIAANITITVSTTVVGTSATGGPVTGTGAGTGVVT